MKTRLGLLFLSAIPAAAMAQLSEQAGFSGEIAINAGYVSSESNFNTDNNATLTSLNQKGDQDGNVIIAPLGNMSYTFGRNLNQQIYIGTERPDLAVGTLAFQLGYKYQLPSGTIIDASFLPTILDSETWENPYDDSGTSRNTTDEGGYAYRLKFNGLIDRNFDLDLAYANKNVEDDKIQDDSLLRDADIYYVKGSYRIPLSRTSMIQPALSFTNQNAQGDAESFNLYQFDVSWFNRINRHALVLTAGYGNRNYQEQSHIAEFNKKRSDNSFRLFAAYEYQNVFDWQNWSFVSFAGYDQKDSNLTFFDETQFISSVGLNYKF